MIILTETTDTLKVALGADQASTPMQCVSVWRDIDATTFTPGRTMVDTNGTASITLLTAPSSSHRRIVDYISVFNADTASKVVVIYFDNDNIAYTLWRGLLEVGQSVVYQDKQGWMIINSFGNLVESTVLTSNDVQIFTTEGAGTWTKPTWFTPKIVQVILVGGGGSGGGGASGTLGNYIYGGSGGGGGAYVSRIYSADDLGATEPLSVASSVAGGAGGAVGGGNGSDGLVGNNSTFLADGPNQLIAYGGGGGYRGVTAAGTSTGGGGGGGGTGGPGSIGTTKGGEGGLPGTSTLQNCGGQGADGGSVTGGKSERGGGGGGGHNASGSSGNGGSSLYGGCGGGCGQGATNASALTVIGSGGLLNSQSNDGTNVQKNDSVNPIRGVSGLAGNIFSGGGGDGGGGTITAATSGADGGDGGAPGGGGGGGGNGVTAGANTGGNGGAGARGEVRVYTW